MTSLPISSILKAKEQFPKIVLSCDIRQYLPAYLEKGFLCLATDVSVPLIQIPEKHTDLFGDTFSDAINHQMNRFLSYHFRSVKCNFFLTLCSAEVGKRQKQFGNEDVKSILTSKHLSLTEGVISYSLIYLVLKFGETVEIPACLTYQTVKMLVQFGLGNAKVRDLGWLVSQLFDISTNVGAIGTYKQDQKKRKVIQKILAPGNFFGYKLI